MARVSPLHSAHEQAEASFQPWGETSSGGALVTETFGEPEVEYAAARKGCILLDQPQRGAVRVRGADRLAFLNRMLTQELKGLPAFQSRRAFWLNRKGRIDADVRLVELGEEMLVDLDVLSAGQLVSTLTSFVIADDVVIDDVSESMHRLALHGPMSMALLGRISAPMIGPPVGDLQPGQACVVKMADRRVVVERQDSIGEVGLELAMEAADAAAVYLQLMEAGSADAAGATPGAIARHGAIRLRAAGWHAYNIARLEAGWPLFNLDFGTDSLPHESGVLEDRVSFTKGCYLGQEVVARMQSLGHPKQKLVALRVGGAAESGPEWQPTTGAAVYAGEPAPDAKPVGAVTSSTRSPMLGDAVICLAQVKWEFIPAGTALWVESPAGAAPAQVQPTLKLWEREVA